MSIFKAEGIVLRVGKVTERELWYKIFFQEYGILMVQKQKKVREKNIDIGYHINCEIITYADKKVSSIGNIHILHFFETKEKSYSDIELFLKIIALLQKELPSGVPHYEIYKILCEIYMLKEELLHQKIILINLKVLSCLGHLPEIHQTISVQKILKFIHSTPIKDILRLKDIPEEIEKQLEQML